ncbi:MAG: hypothetical protein HYY18_17885 [Planctomycetes bacterium]|nr:hypothetical protein [Planctomycetota bacterium]
MRLSISRLAGAFLLFAASAASADVVYMKDGRKIEGALTEKGDQYAVKTKFGTIFVKKAEVERIERDPAGEYAGKAAALEATDADGHFRLGEWCRERSLSTEAAAEFQKALAADPGHEGAHKALGHARMGDRWAPVMEILDTAEGHLLRGETGKARELLQPIADGASETIDPESRRRLWDGMTVLELRENRLPQAREAVEKWAALVPEGDRDSAAARSRIVRDSPDGKFPVRADDLLMLAPDPADAGAPALEPGRHPLWDRRVERIALRAAALKEVDKGIELMKEAEGAGIAEPFRASTLLDSADDCFDRANHIVKDIAVPQQLETVAKLVPLAMGIALDADNGQARINPEGQKYEMEKTASEKIRFTGEGRARFESHRRQWTEFAGKVEACLAILAKVEKRHPEALESQKDLYAKLKRTAADRYPDIRKHFETMLAKYK